MNKLTSLLSLLEENKAFFVILAINFILSFGLLFFIQKADLNEIRKEIQDDFNKDHNSIDSLQTDIENVSWSSFPYTSEWLSAQSTRLRIREERNRRDTYYKKRTKITVDPISKYFERLLVSEFQKKMKNQIRV